MNRFVRLHAVSAPDTIQGAVPGRSLAGSLSALLHTLTVCGEPLADKYEVDSVRVELDEEEQH
ncbi:hypothetical protein [Halopseudomonas sp.]|uniref:hypothetical protein n=1 Tax=Halopseudomonas sp. TaxID=2901191 RepID=UPI00311FE009